ncbi:MAG: hypothetical protein ACRDRX_04405 [Pseudonocardiaceae bacterium]
MTITSLYLDDQAGNTLPLVPHPLITVTGITMGFPEVRAVVEDRPDTDGTRDTTSLIGARAVSITAELYATPATLADAWRAFMAPRKRCYLYCTDTEWAGIGSGTRRILLRADQWSDPIMQGADDVFRAVQAQWRAPEGMWEDATATQVTISAYAPSITGMNFPMKFPIAWTAGSPVTGTIITNLGALPMHFTARLYGSCNGPSLISDTLGKQMTFLSTFAVAAGTYIELDTRERTANRLSSPADSQLANMDLVNTTWWQLQPGQNSIRFVPGSGVVAGSSALITYRQTYL